MKRVSGFAHTTYARVGVCKPPCTIFCKVPPDASTRYACYGTQLDVTPDLLVVEVGKVGDIVNIAAAAIEAEFETFDFTVDKTSFPKVKDEGKASATATISANISFEILTDKNQLTVDSVKAEVVIDTLPIKVKKRCHPMHGNRALYQRPG